jgi:hypothetical protein
MNLLEIETKIYSTKKEGQEAVLYDDLESKAYFGLFKESMHDLTRKKNK